MLTAVPGAWDFISQLQQATSKDPDALVESIVGGKAFPEEVTVLEQPNHGAPVAQPYKVVAMLYNTDYTCAPKSTEILKY